MTPTTVNVGSIVRAWNQVEDALVIGRYKYRIWNGHVWEDQHSGYFITRDQRHLVKQWNEFEHKVHVLRKAPSSPHLNDHIWWKVDLEMPLHYVFLFDTVQEATEWIAWQNLEGNLC